MALNLEFLTKNSLKNKDKLTFILDSVKKQKILVLEEPLSKDEEKELIEKTMTQIDPKKFIGIEIATLGNNDQNLLQKIIQLLGGRKGGFTVIGPANLVKEIKRDPSKLNLIAEE